MATDITTLKSYQDQLQAVAGPNFTCIMAIIVFILADALLTSSFVTFLQTLQAEIQLQQTELQALVAQSTVLLGIIDAELGVLGVVTNVAQGLGNRFPLGALMGCPFIAAPINAVQSGISKATSSLGSSVGFPNPIDKVKRTIRDIQYNEAVLKTKINQMNQAIGQLNLFKSQIQALINFFNAIQSFAGTLPKLPIP